MPDLLPFTPRSNWQVRLEQRPLPASAAGSLTGIPGQFAVKFPTILGWAWMEGTDDHASFCLCKSPARQGSEQGVAE